MKRFFRRVVMFFAVRSNSFCVHWLFSYDKKRFLRHSGAFSQTRKEQKRAAITMSYHILEKGLTMPDSRLGFGQVALLQLIDLLTRFEKEENVDDPVFLHALGVLYAYRERHRECQFELPVRVMRRIDDILEGYPEIEDKGKQIEMTRTQLYSQLDSPFPQFSASRHTMRHLCGEVSEERISRAVALANNAPSACNRQHSRVHCVCSHELRDKILAIQGGNRGFGHTADKLLIVTASLHDIRWPAERNDLYTNGGLYVMNLCYALHYHKIAHCILNWSVTPDVDMALRALLNLPEEESVICAIVCGDCPEKFSIAASPRKPVEEILTFHS